MVTTNDVLRRQVPPKRIENGVTVPPGLQINELTLAERQAMNRRYGLRLLSDDEARKHFPDEAEGPYTLHRRP